MKIHWNWSDKTIKRLEERNKERKNDAAQIEY